MNPIEEMSKEKRRRINNKIALFLLILITIIIAISIPKIS